MRSMLVLPALSLLLACGSSSPSTGAATAQSTDVLSTDEAVAMCVRLHREGATCAAEFSRLNLELRARYVPEFAAAMQDPAQRAAIEAQALEETRTDGGPAVTERCTEFAKPDWGPLPPRADATAADACYGKPSCEERMSCLRPIIEPRYQYRAARAAADAPR